MDEGSRGGVKMATTTILVLNQGRVLYQDADGDGLPEPALLIHRDEGETLVIQQEDRWITLNNSSLRALIAELRKELSK
jgi:hypothetical protein